MKAVVLLAVLFTSVLATPVEQSLVFNEDGSYQFNYDTGSQEGRHARQETRNADGSVEGRYSYEDPDGNLRVVNYRAGKEGFVASGDVGVPGAPKSQLPLVVPTYNEAPEVNSTQGEDDKTTQSPAKDTITTTTTTTTTTPSSDLSDDTTKPTDEGGKKREAAAPQIYGQDFLNLVPLSTPFGRRRLDAPEQINIDDAHYANADVPAEEPAKETPQKEAVPSKPGHGQPLSFIYTVGSPYVPTLLHAPQPEGDKQVQQPHLPDGKGAAQYYIYVPSHHYFGSPSYYFVPQNDLKHTTGDNKDGVSQQASPLVQPESPVSYHPSIQQVAHPALRIQPQAPVVHLPVAQPNLPLTYHTTIQHEVPTKADAPQVTSVGVPHDSPVGVPQESAGGVKIPTAWAYVPVSQPLLHSLPESVPNKNVKPTTLLTYIQPDSAKYVPASKPVDNQVQPQPQQYQSAQPNQYQFAQPQQYQPAQPNQYQPGQFNQYQPAQTYSAPESSPLSSAEQPSLRRPVYHHYVFKSPSASYGYHYQY